MWLIVLNNLEQKEHVKKWFGLNAIVYFWSVKCLKWTNQQCFDLKSEVNKAHLRKNIFLFQFIAEKV